MTKEEFVRNGSWILKVLLERCETQAETDYLNYLIERLEQEPKFIIKSDGTIEQIKTEWEKIGEFISGVQPKPKTDVLDKIRAEIEKIPTAPFATAYTVKSEALKIINKYKAESEAE